MSLQLKRPAITLNRHGAGNEKQWGTIRSKGAGEMVQQVKMSATQRCKPDTHQSSIPGSP